MHYALKRFEAFGVYQLANHCGADCREPFVGGEKQGLGAIVMLFIPLGVYQLVFEIPLVAYALYDSARSKLVEEVDQHSRACDRFDVFYMRDR